MSKANNIDLICADQSMRCPGFALQRYSQRTKKVKVIKMSAVNNKKEKKKSHGQILSEIAHEQHSYIKLSPDAILVREAALYNVPGGTVKTVAVLHKVVGISDLYGWAANNKVFEELSPTTIKSLVAGNKSASKEEVAAALEKYIGKQEYETDDESDAVACGIAWLLKKKYLDPQDG